MQAPPERLGAFYLGAEYDLPRGERLPRPLMYDARDLTTHAVCVGMTGSGKTGLCIDLLEEAAIDQVPALIVDPKGDMTNLLLQFPELRPEDFRPWVNVDDARRKGLTVAEYAAQIAQTWRRGLADWGQAPDRIRLVRESVDYTIYTPGSDAGIPINILGSLAAPPLDFEAHAEVLRERITGTTLALLGLAGIDADPIRSREAVLMANLFEHFWRRGEDVDLAKLILAIQDPPVRRLGVFDVDTFYPQKERFDLAMRFNALVAAPSFQNWLTGEPLDIDRLYFTPEGRPRHSIFYIAHLSDAERMFFVTLLLEALVTWVRAQTGTTSLRALLYFDEVFGFFPPVQEPPSKRPLLTLLKQARAFGLGVVLVTQNPVDIDYKGLTNAGTWFIGKLQAERDKDRVLEGLKGALAEAGQLPEALDYDAIIGGLRSRVFLMHNVHEEGPVVFHTRWAMSYLRGPLTRPQVAQLMGPRKEAWRRQQAASAPRPPGPSVRETEAPAGRPPSQDPTAGPAMPAPPEGFSPDPPALAPSVPVVYLPVALDEEEAVDWVADQVGQEVEAARIQLIYEPAVLGVATVRFLDRRRKIDAQEDLVLLAPVQEGVVAVDWEEAEFLAVSVEELERGPARVAPEQGPFFAPVPSAVNTVRELRRVARDLSDWLYYNRRLPLKAHPTLKQVQRPEESDRAFRIRLQEAARERRDQEVERLRRKYRRRLERLRDRLERYQRELALDEAEYEARRQQQWISIGESVLGFFLGRRSTRALSTAASKRRMATRARMEIERTRAEIEDLRQEIAALEAELEEAAREITRKWAEALDELDVVELKPRRADVDVEMAALAWVPSWLVVYSDGGRTRSAAVAAYPVG